MKQSTLLKAKINLSLNLLVFFALASFCFGTNYYVSYSLGNDNNNGTIQSTPWKTINKLNTCIFQPGDTIMFKRGDMWYEPSWNARGQGTDAAWITVTAYGSGNKPRIQCSNWYTPVIALDWANSRWKFYDLEIKGGYCGIHWRQTHTRPYAEKGLWIENCWIHHGINDVDYNCHGSSKTNLLYGMCQSTGIFIKTEPQDIVTGAPIEKIQNVTIKDCYIEYYGQAGLLANVDGCDVRGNIFADNYRAGMTFDNVDDGIVYDNHITNSGTSGMDWGTAGLQLNNCTNAYISYNRIDYTQAPNCPDGVAELRHHERDKIEKTLFLRH